MKFPYKISVLIGVCNITLFLLATAAVISLIYTVQGPYVPESEQEFKGVTSYKTSQYLLGRQYVYQMWYDAENQIRQEYAYYVPGHQSYHFAPKEAPGIKGKKMDPDLSRSEMFGLKSLKVFTDEISIPILAGSAGIELEKDQLIRLMRLNYFSVVLASLYLCVLFWYIRRFVTGLKDPSFFNSDNAKNLHVAGYMVLITPFLHYVWYFLTDPGFSQTFLIEGASRLGVGQAVFQYELLIAGLIIVIFAWAFEQGVKLQKEQELTI